MYRSSASGSTNDNKAETSMQSFMSGLLILYLFIGAAVDATWPIWIYFLYK